MRHNRLRLLLHALWPLTLAAVASAQERAPAERVPFSHDSGPVENLGADLDVVHGFAVQVQGAAWLRLSFAEVVLAGDPALGNGALLRLTSMTDGHVQLLNAEHVEQWRSTSAYFNGDGVWIEILAHPGTGPSRVRLDEVTVALPPPLASICAGDDRELSADPRIGRLMPLICTGFLVNDECGCLLSAGHCDSGMEVVEFDVPLSNGGAVVHPPPEDQYAIDPASLQSNGGQGPGDDFAYFGVFPNSNTGLTPRQAQGDVFEVAPAPAFAADQEIRITGYGFDNSPFTHNYVQQTSVGLRMDTLMPVLEYQTDSMGGNSGGPVILEETEQVIGIHSHGGCTDFDGNRGGAITQTGLLLALAQPRGVCAQSHGTVLAYGEGVGGANVATLTSSAGPQAGGVLTLDLGGLAIDTQALIWFSPQSADQPLVGGTLLADITTAIFWIGLPVVGGQGGVQVDVPPTAQGVTLFLQGAAQDGSQAAGWALTNGLEILFG